VEVTGDDVTAWVEVAFEGVGWIPFYPTPDETEIPQDQTPQPKSEPQPQVRQPPRSEVDQDDLVSAVELDDPDDTPPGFVIPRWVWTVVTIIAVPLALYFVPLILVALHKRRRRNKRRAALEPDKLAAGAWDELVDTYAELGYAAPRKSTRLQLALGFEEQFRLELEARELERTAVVDRASTKAAREEAKRQKALPATPDTSVSALDVTVMRAPAESIWRPGVDDSRAPLPAIPGLREFAVRADAAVFSGLPIEKPAIDALWAEVGTAAEAARRSVGRFRRQLSRFRIRPRRDVADALARSIASAVPATPKGLR
jgi:hypothetical protein